jgi:hypothetical protein
MRLCICFTSLPLCDFFKWTICFLHMLHFSLPYQINSVFSLIYIDYIFYGSCKPVEEYDSLLPHSSDVGPRMFLSYSLNI